MNYQEVLKLREEIFADGKVTKEEVELLWSKKDELEETSVEFDSLFAEAVMAWLLDDGIIDEEEAQYIINKITEDDTIDNAELELLYSLNDVYQSGLSLPKCLLEAFPDFFTEDEEEGIEE